MKNINAKVISTEDQNVMEGIFGLRHNVYVNEKGWAPDSGNQIERDHYDEYAGYIAVLKQNETSGADEVIATARFISLEKKVMLDDEFKELVEGAELVRENAIEITRIAIDKKYRNKRLDILIYRELIQWSSENNVRHWYFVVEPKYLHYLNHFGITAVQIGKPKIFPDGVEAMAVYIDLKHVLEVLKSKNNRFYNDVA
jgi:N-acyl-L-homoserine lactone synthetase